MRSASPAKSHVVVVPLVDSVAREKGGVGSMLRIAIENSGHFGEDNPVRP